MYLFLFLLELTAANQLQEQRLLDVFMPPDLWGKTSRKLRVGARFQALPHITASTGQQDISQSEARRQTVLPLAQNGTHTSKNGTASGKTLKTLSWISFSKSAENS